MLLLLLISRLLNASLLHLRRTLFLMALFTLLTILLVCFRHTSVCCFHTIPTHNFILNHRRMHTWREEAGWHLMVWISLTEKVRVLIWVVEGRHTVHVLKWVVGVALGACYVALALVLGGKVHMTLMAGRWAKAIRNTTRTALFPFPKRQVSWISVIPTREQSWRIHPLRTALLLLQVKQIHCSVAGSRIVTILHLTILIRKPMTISTKRVDKIVR